VAVVHPAALQAGSVRHMRCHCGCAVRWRHNLTLTGVAGTVVDGAAPKDLLVPVW